VQPSVEAALSTGAIRRCRDLTACPAHYHRSQSSWRPSASAGSFFCYAASPQGGYPPRLC